MYAWYSYKGKKYNGSASPYSDLEGIQWYDKLKAELPQIKQELSRVLKIDGIDIQKYFNKDLVEGKAWEGIGFIFWKLRNENSINKGKDLFNHFKDIPGLVSLSISILQPKTRIKGHYGDTDAIYRIHIPIHIPAGLPDCGITVGGITRPWIENDMIVFCDAHFHEAWNMTNEPRVIMIMDVIKEEYLSQTDDICANVLSSIKYQHVSQKYKFIKKFPGWAKDLLRRSLKLLPARQLS